MKSESKRPITIEDLLHLKRAEVPPADFWSTFDRELRAKQLAALVAKRPWWQRLPKSFSKLARYRIPLGASAVLAITFFTVRDDDGISAPVDDSAIPVAAVDDVVPAAEFRTENMATAAPTQLPSTVVPMVVAQRDIPEAAVDVSPVFVTSELPPRTIPLGGVTSFEDEADAASPAARRIAANLAVVQSPDPLYARSLLGATHGFEARQNPPRTAVEPLQQMTLPSDTRRSRLLTAMVSTASF